jgi:hypothetical protein
MKKARAKSKKERKIVEEGRVIRGLSLNSNTIKM